VKLLHVIASLDPRCGGPSAGLREIVQVDFERSYASEILCFDPPEAGHLAGPVPIQALGRGHLGYGLHLGALSWMDRHLRRFDAVVVHGLWQFHGPAVRWATRRVGIPYFVFPHGMLGPWFRRNYPFKHVKKALYWWVAEYPVLRDAAGIFYTCQDELEHSTQSFGKFNNHGFVLGFGTARAGGECSPGPEPFLSAFPSLRGRRILLFLGRIHVVKGCDLLIRAFSRIAPRDPNLHLVMAGPADEGLLAKLRAMAAALGLETRISWTGMLENTLKWSALRAAEVVCLPSHHENFGVTIAEALSCGTPAVLSDKVGIWREVLGAGAGWVDEDTVEGVTRGLARWLDTSPSEMRQMRSLAVRCFESRFDIADVATRIRDQIRQSGLTRNSAFPMAGN
jgi:glycosyltransferase involved in cell wall biosynthesis